MERRSALPWWQLARTARGAFTFGSIYLFLGLGNLVLGLLGDDLRSWRTVFTVGLLLLGLGYLASGLAQFRRARQGDANQQIHPTDHRRAP